MNFENIISSSMTGLFFVFCAFLTCMVLTYLKPFKDTFLRKYTFKNLKTIRKYLVSFTVFSVIFILIFSAYNEIRKPSDKSVYNSNNDIENIKKLKKERYEEQEEKNMKPKIKEFNTISEEEYEEKINWKK